jgi:hypothetical protein
MQELANNYESAFSGRLADAMKEPWDKLHKMLTHMSEKLTEEEVDNDADEKTKKRYHDTLITNAQDLCGLLSHLNITKDPKLEEARRELETTMLGIDIDTIKEHASVRSNVKSKVDAILNKFDW